MWPNLKKLIPPLPYLFAALVVAVLLWLAWPLWSRKTPVAPVPVIVSQPGPQETRDRATYDSLMRVR